MQAESCLFTGLVEVRQGLGHGTQPSLGGSYAKHMWGISWYSHTVWELSLLHFTEEEVETEKFNNLPEVPLRQWQSRL